MFHRSLVRRAAAAAFLASLVACGDSGVTSPDTFDAPLPTPQFDIVELLIQFNDPNGDGTTGSIPPSFSLASLPSTVVEDHAWSRSGIPVDPYSGFAPDMAVDYGDGTGAHSVAVTQSGGNLALNPDGTWTQQPISFSFSLSHTYANPGTYTVEVIAATYGDYPSSRVRTAAITVTSDPDVYIEDFQISSPVVQGTPAQFSFKARGPGTDLYDVKVSYGTNLTQTSAVYPGAIYSDSYTWAEPGTYTLKAIITHGEYADTLTRSVVVAPAPITISAFEVTDSLFRGDTGAFTVSAQGPAGDPYSVEVDFGDGSDAAALHVAPGGAVSGEHVWAGSGLFEVRVVVSNGIVADTSVAEVAVYRAPPSLDDLEMPDTLGFSVPSEIVFTTNDANEGTVLGYSIALYVGGVLAGEIGPETSGRGETVRIPIEAPDYLVEIDLVFVLQSGQNGLLLADTVERHLSIVNAVCLAGTYKAGYNCVPAPIGSFVPVDGAEAATACEEGTYQDQEGQVACIPAPAGSFVAFTGAAEATLCPAGSYQDQQGGVQCKEAPAGGFVDQVGATQSTLCAPGTFQESTGSVSCEDAPLGSFVGGPGQTEAQLCAAGYYSDVTGAIACTAAPAGRFVAFDGASSSELCPAGTFQALSGQTGCDAAPAGTFVNVTGAAQATPCAPGTYQPLEGSTGCLDAPAGSFVSISGAEAATLCVLGTFQADAAQTGCDFAPTGSYVDVTGASSATACPVGSSTTATGSTSIDACIALGVILLGDIERAVSDGTLVPAGNGKGGEQQMNGWISGLERSVRFLEGPQKQAGCVGVRNALAKADGNGSPKDQVTGPGRAAIAAALQRILDENGCGG